MVSLHSNRLLLKTEEVSVLLCKIIFGLGFLFCVRQGLLARLVLPILQCQDYRNGLLHVVDMLGTSRASSPQTMFLFCFIFYLFKTKSCYAAQVGPKSLCLSHPPALASEYGGDNRHLAHCPVMVDF